MQGREIEEIENLLNIQHHTIVSGLALNVNVKKMNCRCCIVLIVKKKLEGRGISVLEDICTLKFLYASADPT